MSLSPARMLQGAVAGCLATLPMTWVMERMHRRLAEPNRYHLPPYEVSMNSLQRLGLPPSHLNPRQRRWLTLAMHFGYGALVGAFYPALFKTREQNRIGLGATYGVGVWSASYLGWIPALGLLTPAYRHPAERNRLMIGAHLVWGASLSLAQDWLMAQDWHDLPKRGTPYSRQTLNAREDVSALRDRQSPQDRQMAQVQRVTAGRVPVAATGLEI